MSLDFEKFDFTATRDLYKAAEPKSPGLLGNVADTGLQLAQGVLQGGEMLANTFGADNPLSQRLRKGSEWLASNFSDQLKWEQLTSAQDMKAAELSGSTWEEIKAAARSFGRDPVGYLANAAGTTLPTIAAAFLPGGQGALLGRLAAVSMGSAQGAGAVKGQIYSEVEKAWKEAGASDEEAEARAAAAQAYLGSNSGQIILGAALGGIAGGTGAEAGILARRAGGMGADVAADAAATTGASIFGRAAATVPRVFREGVKEALPEAAQGGQEALAGNLALQNEGFDVSTWGGVASSATLEGLAGGVFGAATSPFTRPPVPQGADAPPPAAPDLGDPDQAMREIGRAQTVDDAIEAATRVVSSPLSIGWNERFEPEGGFANDRPIYTFGDGTSVLTAEGAAAEIEKKRAISNLTQWFDRLPTPFTEERAGELARLATERSGAPMSVLPLPDGSGFTVVPTAWANTPGINDYITEARAAFEVDQERRDRITQAASAPVDRAPRTRGADAVLVDPSAPNAVAQYVDRMRSTNTLAARAFVKDFEAGRITPDDVMALVMPRKAEQTADERLAAAAAQAPADQAATLPLERAQPDTGTMLLTADGFPYGTRSGAVIRARREGLGPENVVEVEGGFAVRTAETEDVAVPDVAGTPEVPAGPADGRGDNAGGSLGDLRPDPAGQGGLGGPAAASGGRVAAPGAVGDAGDAGGALSGPAPGSDAGNGFKHGPSTGERYRTGTVAAAGGAVVFEKRLPAGTAATFYVGKDGNLIDSDDVNFIGSGRERLWIPRSQEEADQARAILDEMGRLKLTDKRRQDAKARLKALVASSGGRPSPQQAATPPANEGPTTEGARDGQGLQEEGRGRQEVAPADPPRASNPEPAADLDESGLDQSQRQFLFDRGFQDNGPRPREWVMPISNLGDVIAKVVSKPGEPIRAEISADYMGKRLGTRVAEGQAAIDEAIKTAREGINAGREKLARQFAADERGLPGDQAPKSLTDRVQRLRKAAPTRTEGDTPQTDAADAAPRELIELRKREVVLKKLLDCMRE